MDKVYRYSETGEYGFDIDFKYFSTKEKALDFLRQRVDEYKKHPDLASDSDVMDFEDDNNVTNLMRVESSSIRSFVEMFRAYLWTASQTECGTEFDIHSRELSVVEVEVH